MLVFALVLLAGAAVAFIVGWWPVGAVLCVLAVADVVCARYLARRYSVRPVGSYVERERVGY